MIKKSFLKGHANVLNILIRLVDLSVVLTCSHLAYYFSAAFETYTAAGVQGLPGHYLKVSFLAVAFTALLFPLFNIYRVWRGTSTLTEIKHLTMAWLMVGFLLTGLAFATKSGADFSRSWMGLWFVSTWMSLVGARVIMRLVLC